MNKFLRYFYGILLTGFVAACLSVGQKAQAQNEGGQFANLNAGFGQTYSGLGLNGEYGKDPFGISISFGYQWKQKFDDILLDESFNWAVGLRYYIKVGNEMVYPRVGLQFGWVTNYYDARIEDNPYEPEVYALSGQLGVQVYSQRFFIFNLDLFVTPEFTVLDLEDHPHFYPYLIRPAIGIGLDLTQFLSSLKKTEKNQKNKPINIFDK